MLQLQWNNELINVSFDDSHWHIAMQIFCVTGHTGKKYPVAINNRIRDFVYFDISRKQISTPKDWEVLSNISSASLLFSNDGTFWGIPAQSGGIDYYSVLLKTNKNNRSQLAYEVHKVFSRITQMDFSVILFEAQDKFLFSFAIRNEGINRVLLSDWFSENDFFETDLIERLNVAAFSSNYIEDFFLDFEYSVARDYYIHPKSHEYAAYEMFPLNMQTIDNVMDRETINEIIRENYLSTIIEYGDDYVENEDDNQDLPVFSTDDISMSLIELEIDENKNKNSDSEDIEEYGEDDNAEDSNNNDNDYLDEINDDIFSNPSKLLSFLGN